MPRKPLYRRWPGILPLALSGAIVCGQVKNRVDSEPGPPCGTTPVPAYPGVDQLPVVKAWDRSELGRDWTPPACTGWTTTGFTTLVVTAALFRHGSGVEGLLRRIGAISELAGTRYWSTTHKRWQTLIVDAYALRGPAGDRRRNDFPPDKITTGTYLYFRQEDNLAGKAIYRMYIQSISHDRLVFETENVSSVRYLMWPLFRPGELQAIYFLERDSADVWRYYSISRTGRNASSLTGGRDASSINRAVAYYRFLAGIPTDQEPPAAP